MKKSGWVGRGSGGPKGSDEWGVSKRLSGKAGVKPEEESMGGKDGLWG